MYAYRIGGTCHVAEGARIRRHDHEHSEFVFAVNEV